MIFLIQLDTLYTVPTPVQSKAIKKQLEIRKRHDFTTIFDFVVKPV